MSILPIHSDIVTTINKNIDSWILIQLFMALPIHYDSHKIRGVFLVQVLYEALILKLWKNVIFSKLIRLVKRVALRGQRLQDLN